MTASGNESARRDNDEGSSTNPEIEKLIPQAKEDHGLRVGMTLESFKQGLRSALLLGLQDSGHDARPVGVVAVGKEGKLRTHDINHHVNR